MHSPGWATLMTILESSGERPPKRPYGLYFGHDDEVEISALARDKVSPSNIHTTTDNNSVDTLAKRVKRSSLG